jgi:uncharacterized DUF497 family protein
VQNIFDMCKENQNQLAVNLLTEVNAVGTARFQEMKVFFSEAFLLHTSDDAFDDSEYRQQWADNIQALHALSQAFGDVNPEFVRIKLSRAIDCLSGKELSHE